MILFCNKMKIEQKTDTQALVSQIISDMSQDVAAIEAVVKAIDNITISPEELIRGAVESTAAAEKQPALLSQLTNNASNLEEDAK